MSSRRIMTDFVLLISQDWHGRVSEVANAVRWAGGEVISVDEENCILEGSIQSMDLSSLERLACVRQLVEGASYVAYGFPGGDDHGSSSGQRGEVHQGTRAHAPKRPRASDAGPGTLRPSASRPKPGTAVRLPAGPPTIPGLNRAVPHPGHLDYSDRLLWQAHDSPPCARPHERPTIPLGARLAYGMVLALGVAIATRTAMNHGDGDYSSVSQLSSCVLLATLATLAACGLCRFPLVRHACTCMCLWLALSPCFVERSFSGADMLLGLAAFLLAGCAAETLGDTWSSPWKYTCDLVRANRNSAGHHPGLRGP